MKVKVENPFKEGYSDERDLELVALALEGDRVALADLIGRNQQFIYNVALKMVNHVPDAEDVTQEVLVKVLTHLARFDRSKGRFRTWLYRITFNHILNLKRQPYEQVVTGIDVFWGYIEGSEVVELGADEELELAEEIEESKLACMAGMLMCLDREQRLVYIVGEVFEIDHRLGGEFFGISPDNFRQQLSRARKDLHAWMHQRCGLMNAANPCRCPKKTRGFIANGWVDPVKLKWNSDYALRIRELTETGIEPALLTIDEIYAGLYRDHPFKRSSKVEGMVDAILGSADLRELFRLGEPN